VPGCVECGVKARRYARFIVQETGERHFELRVRKEENAPASKLIAEWRKGTSGSFTSRTRDLSNTTGSVLQAAAAAWSQRVVPSAPRGKLETSRVAPRSSRARGVCEERLRQKERRARPD
jgi:hypothetical protein